MGMTEWRISNTNFQSLYLGEAFLVGAGRFNIDLDNGEGTTYRASYRGIGGGVGAGIPTGEANAMLRFILEVAPGIVSQLASDFIDEWGISAGSRLYAFGDEPLDDGRLNRSLFILNLGAEATLSIQGNVILWCRRITSTTVSSRTGARYSTSYLDPIAIAVVGGVSPGAVGIAATITHCSCTAFNH